MIALLIKREHEEDCGSKFKYTEFIGAFRDMQAVNKFMKEVALSPKHVEYLEIQEGLPASTSSYGFSTLYEVNTATWELGNMVDSGYRAYCTPEPRWTKDDGALFLSPKLGEKIKRLRFEQPGYDPALAQEYIDLMRDLFRVKRLRLSLGEVVQVT